MSGNLALDHACLHPYSTNDVAVLLSSENEIRHEADFLQRRHGHTLDETAAGNLFKRVQASENLALHHACLHPYATHDVAVLLRALGE